MDQGSKPIEENPAVEDRLQEEEAIGHPIRLRGCFFQNSSSLAHVV